MDAMTCEVVYEKSSNKEECELYFNLKDLIEIFQDSLESIPPSYKESAVVLINGRYEQILLSVLYQRPQTMEEKEKIKEELENYSQRIKGFPNGTEQARLFLKGTMERIYNGNTSS